MNDALLLLLRVVHILGGIFWMGGAFIVGLFVFPAARALGPAGMPMVQDIMLRRKLAVYLPISAVLSVFAGLTLFWRDMKLSGGAWGRSPMGMGMSFGAACAIVAIIFGMAVASPAAKKLAGAGAPGAAVLSEGELARLRKRAATGSLGAMIFLFLAAIAMSVARYL